jgi:hypothetical protein
VSADAHTGGARERVARWLVALIAAGTAAAVVAFALQHAYSLYDDAYIYLRYVDNLARGCGLRFNCGEAPVEGFTSPLYLAVLALGRLLTPDLETVTQIAGTLFLVAALALPVWLAARLGRGFGPAGAVGLALAVALPLALDHHVLLNAVIGLETPLGCLAAAALLAAVLSPDQRGLRIVLPLAVLCRPEFAAFALLLPVLPRARRPRYLLPLAAAVALIVLGRWLVFHDLAPNTYWAKAGGTPDHLRLGARYLWELVEAHPLLVAAPLALLARETRPAVIYFLAGSALWLISVWRAGGDTFLYGRLAMPLVPALTCLAVFGLASAGVRAASSLRALDPRAAWGAVAALAAGLGVRAAVIHHLPPTHGFDNVQRWSAVGRWLRDHHPRDTLAVVPIGAIGYFSRAPVIDLVGLTSRAIARAGRGLPPGRLNRGWIGHERHNTEWVLAQCPDLLVMTKSVPRSGRHPRRLLRRVAAPARHQGGPRPLRPARGPGGPRRLLADVPAPRPRRLPAARDRRLNAQGVHLPFTQRPLSQ